MDLRKADKPVPVRERQGPQQDRVDRRETALLAPIPNASVSTTVTEKAGDLASERSDRRTWRRMASKP
jgi:hypothetical protein